MPDSWKYDDYQWLEVDKDVYLKAVKQYVSSPMWTHRKSTQHGNSLFEEEHASKNITNSRIKLKHSTFVSSVDSKQTLTALIIDLATYKLCEYFA